MPNLTLSVDEDLKAQMDDHPEINWSQVARSAIREKLRDLQVMEELVEGSELTAEDVEDIAAEIDRRATERAMEDLDEAAGPVNG